MIKFSETLFEAVVIMMRNTNYSSMTHFSPGMSSKLVRPVQLISSFWEEIRPKNVLHEANQSDWMRNQYQQNHRRPKLRYTIVTGKRAASTTRRE